MDFEVGIQHLLDQLVEKPPQYKEVLLLKARLERNIRDEKLFGTSENTQLERSRIISALNQIALSSLGISINELARHEDARHSRLADLAINIRESYALIREYEIVIQVTSDPKEIRRARISIDEQRQLMETLLSEYTRLVNELNVEIPIDIKQISTTIDTSKEKDSEYKLSAIRDLLVKSFSESDLRLLCYDLGIDFDTIRGSSKNQKVIELLDYLERRSRTEELVTFLQRQRPGRLNQ